MAQNKLSAFDPKLLSGFRGDSEKRETSSYVHDKDRLANWDKRYIEVAAHVAAWSKDPDARVGCVIVSPTYGRAVTFSFNGFPANVTDSIEHLHHEDKNEKLDRILHAEQNALLYAGRDAKECHAYVVGKPVCNTCAIMLIQAGIRRVVAAPPLLDSDKNWDKRGRLALTMFKQAGVEFTPIDEAKHKELIEKYDLPQKKTKKQKKTALAEQETCC
jgi:dCMP deaminase